VRARSRAARANGMGRRVREMDELRKAG